MPEEAKKKNQKGRSDPKEPRRPRHRNQPGPVEKKTDNKEDESKAHQKPVFEEPGPEFYKNLKRETDEILKITEEENSKYKKKEIQSNWSKYEMPIESYDEIQEQENMGADYEKLIEAPLSVGGYFQFKHEKSWDVDTGPSPYDKYFEINMDNLFLSLTTIPFHERNKIQKKIFTETDILNMNNRATRSKQKYYNDKSFSTTEMELQNSLIQQLSSNTTEESDLCTVKNDVYDVEDIDIVKSSGIENNKVRNNDPNILFQEVSIPEVDITQIEINKPVSKREEINTEEIKKLRLKIEELEDIDDILLGTTEKEVKLKEDSIGMVTIPKDLVGSTSQKQETQKTPIIESPEDLEKWLDDFLDE